MNNKQINKSLKQTQKTLIKYQKVIIKLQNLHTSGTIYNLFEQYEITKSVSFLISNNQYIFVINVKISQSFV